MSLRTLYNVILKVIGLFFLKDLLIQLPSFITVIPTMFSADRTGEVITYMAPLTLTMFFYFLGVYFLLFRTVAVVARLRLAEGAEDLPVRFNIHRSTIFLITVTIIALLVIIDAIAPFTIGLLRYINRPRGIFEDNISVDKLPFLIPGVKLIMAVILLIYQRDLMNFVEKQRRDDAAENETEANRGTGCRDERSFIKLFLRLLHAKRCYRHPYLY